MPMWAKREDFRGEEKESDSAGFFLADDAVFFAPDLY